MMEAMVPIPIMEDSDCNHPARSSGGGGGGDGDGHVAVDQRDQNCDDGDQKETIPTPLVDNERSEPCDEDKDELSVYTCPICLCELDAIRSEGSDSEEINDADIPIFTLACQHKYCLPCLHEYVRSKLVGGDLQISCCHLHPTATDEEKEDLCNVAIARCDIKRLIHMDYLRRHSYVSAWSGKHQSTTAQDPNKTASDELWEKFKKLEFDRLHGKDAVRRCPTCDEAALFDVDAMKRHQAKFESIRTENATRVSAPTQTRSNNVSSRFFRSNRQTQDSNNTATATTTTDDASNNAEESPADEDDEEQPTVLETEGDLDSEEVVDAQIAENCLVKSKSPVITCRSCTTEFCYFHSNAHQGKSCFAYHNETLQADRTNIEFATRVLRAKPCPNCGISVSKEGGCNQMKCSSCNTNFCWLCSEIIDDGPFPDHFRWWNISGCPNMQLDERDQPNTCTVVFARVLSFLQLLILGVPSIALAVVSMIVCPCMIPGCGSNMRDRVINCVSFWGSFLSSLIMLPFTLLAMLLVASLYCFVAAITFCLKIPKNNDSTSGQRVDQTARRTSPIDNVAIHQASTEELLRELEILFGRLEEGSFREGTELAPAASSV
eukprot:CAMPEP_0201692226 /NCGR_PEP_ID=MMETSP0578-20130828/5187_1 /ASSEMBLY_ACC=CAM_ASM_000663 /TAXON_ID=267565 /ORGANISM="Skeletonema grethea, Strain CCMP 1804" /LENGTH=605 /DNA_ID=CAMNT_0048177575 /DNA_START=9 /DNA_END=1826 /DNA_ORIENTATION=+